MRDVSCWEWFSSLFTKAGKNCCHPTMAVGNKNIIINNHGIINHGIINYYNGYNGHNDNNSIMTTITAGENLSAAETSSVTTFLEKETYIISSPGCGDVIVTLPSPLEQFSIFPLIPMKMGNLYFSFTNPSLFMLLTLSLVLLLLYFVTKNGGGKPKAR